jgi:glycerol-3-phosphate dehydrogenase
VGDLYVTAAAGRNREYGERIAGGIEPKEALRLMLAGGQIAEGYPALRQGGLYLKRKERPRPEELPLFELLHNVVLRGANAEHGLRDFLRSL